MVGIVLKFCRFVVNLRRLNWLYLKVLWWIICEMLMCVFFWVVWFVWLVWVVWGRVFWLDRCWCLWLLGGWCCCIESWDFIKLFVEFCSLISWLKLISNWLVVCSEVYLWCMLVFLMRCGKFLWRCVMFVGWVLS